MSRLNILFVFTDQHRWDALGCTGGWVRTPNLDRIAATGIVFSNCVTNAPVCVPARMSLVTGLYPHNTGIWTNSHATLRPEARTWIRDLHKLGYRTSVFGKTHLHSRTRAARGRPNDLRDREGLLRAYGFDDMDEAPGPQAATRVHCRMTEEWDKKGLLAAFRRDMYERRVSNIPIIRPSPLGLADYYDVYVGRRAAKYLRDYNSARPWFCWVGFPGPHSPYDAPEPYASMYRPEEMPTPIEWSRELLEEPGHRPRGWLDRKFSTEGGRVRPEVAKNLRANYAGSVSLIDDLVGEILAVIERRGELERTAIVFAADHGEMNGDFGLLSKSNLLDSAVRIPLVIRIPEPYCARPARAQCADPVELLDIGPTLVELAGGAPEPAQFGRSLVHTFRHQTRQHRRDAIAEHRHEVMLCDHSWKIALNRWGEAYLLFNRTRDPWERHNLAGDGHHRDVEHDLMNRMRDRLRASQMPRPQAKVARVS